MDSQNQSSLQQEFEAAVARVDNLPGDQAAAHMTELYGLFKQATEGDHDTRDDRVGDDSPDMPSGYVGMSQAQWDSWSKFKGMPEDEAKRHYIEKVNEVAGPAAASNSGSAVSSEDNGADAGRGDITGKHTNTNGGGSHAASPTDQPTTDHNHPAGAQVGSGDRVGGNEAPASGTAKAPYENQPGVSMGGLQGDINDGAPYGGEDRLKTQQ